MKQIKSAFLTIALLLGLTAAAMADTTHTTTTTTVTTVDSSASIAVQLEANRAQELAELRPHFKMMLNEIADQLDADQGATLQGWAVNMDLHDLAMMDREDQVSFLAEMSQRLNLRGAQVTEIRPIVAEHLGEMHNIHLTFLDRERAILATRVQTTTVISTPVETTTTIKRTTTTTTEEIVPAPAP